MYLSELHHAEKIKETYLERTKVTKLPNLTTRKFKYTYSFKIFKDAALMCFCNLPFPQGKGENIMVKS